MSHRSFYSRRGNRSTTTALLTTALLAAALLTATLLAAALLAATLLSIILFVSNLLTLFHTSPSLVTNSTDAESYNQNFP